ncbi:MAG: DsbA family protein [Bifidobacteriaceae bacterium]|nr:DsbA family protein [Bifidobacteriaceae bacterium]
MKLPGIPVGPHGVAGAGHPGGPETRVDVFLDYMCPYCQKFERENGRTLQHLVDGGRARWIIHPVAFLDDASNGTRYSSRSAAAAYAVSQLAGTRFGQFHNALFAGQPHEGTDGPSDARIAAVAVEVGVPDAQAAQLTDPRYVTVAEASTASAVEFGVDGTPTVLVSRPGVSKVYSWDGSTSIVQLVDALAQAAPAATRMGAGAR